MSEVMNVSVEADAFLQQLQADAEAEAASAAEPALTAAVPAPVSEAKVAAAPTEQQAQPGDNLQAVPHEAATAERPGADGPAVSQPEAGTAEAATEPAANGVSGDAPVGADGSAERPRKRRNRWGAPAVDAEATPGTEVDGQQPKRKRRSRWEDPVENTETALANVLPKEITLPGGIKVCASKRLSFAVTPVLPTQVLAEHRHWVCYANMNAYPTL